MNIEEAAPTATVAPNYAAHKEFLKDFFRNFAIDKAGRERPYFEAMQHVADYEERVFVVNVDDICQYESGGVNGEELAEEVMRNTKRYMSLMCEAIDEAMPDPQHDPLAGGDEHALAMAHPVDLLMRSRRLRQQEAKEADGGVGAAKEGGIPAELSRRYELRLRASPKSKALSVREVRASQIGRLVQVKGMVTRVSEVKPLVRVATYTCDTCPCEIYQVVKSKSFMPLVDCPTPQCKASGLGGNLQMQTRASKFEAYQELKIQELPEQVPVGHIPRTLTVQAHGSMAGQASPGDIVTVQGVFLPTPYTGYRALRAGLVADTYVEAVDLVKHKKSFTELQLTEAMEDQVEELRLGPDVFTRLAMSIAPEIYGQESIKKALLLQLVSGVSRTMTDGMKIRGDINILLMGDPGVAKSQMLKHITRIAPRSVYTTGKGSSGVGLTAAVMRDPMSKEMTLEGGALVIADMGICCIDEFDKMDESDRTAIHEVMEQQTVSIAKAGITTTLNARTSVLAAANPVYGRYNLRRTVSENVNLPAALLSRFDLVFIMLDRPSVGGGAAEEGGEVAEEQGTDFRLAKHICEVHAKGKAPKQALGAVPPDVLRAYVTMARRVNPHVTLETRQKIVERYVQMRAEDREQMKQGEGQKMTARQLLSLLRLAQAHARVHFREVVTMDDVEEAIRVSDACHLELLVEKRRAELGAVAGRARGHSGLMSQAWRALVKYLQQQREETCTLVQAVDTLLRVPGVSRSLAQETLKMYAHLDQLAVDSATGKVSLVSHE